MNFLKRNMSFSRYQYSGNISLSKECLVSLDANSFRGSADREQSCGWVSCDNILQRPTSFEMSEPFLKLCLRVDKRKISSEILKANIQRDITAASSLRKLSTIDKREIHRQAKECLLVETSPCTNIFRAIVDIRKSQVYFLSNSPNAKKIFTRLFSETFSIDLVEMKAHPLEIWGITNPIKEYILENDGEYLGADFLTWMLFNGKMKNWEISPDLPKKVSYGIDQQLLLFPEIEGNTLKITGASPASTDESLIALRDGSKVKSARFYFVYGEDEFYVTLRDDFSFSSLRLMPPTSTDQEDRFQEYANGMVSFLSIFDASYKHFLSIRLNAEKWDKEKTKIDKFKASKIDNMKKVASA